MQAQVDINVLDKEATENQTARPVQLSFIFCPTFSCWRSYATTCNSVRVRFISVRAC